MLRSTPNGIWVIGIYSHRITFTADNLEDNPTQFAVGLERCGNVTLVEYEDDQGNSPDLSRMPEPTCNAVRQDHHENHSVLSHK